MGVAYGQGKRTSYLSSFLIGLYLDDKLYPITKLGSGFT
jgi:ATP-dependent DNA ligase